MDLNGDPDYIEDFNSVVLVLLHKALGPIASQASAIAVAAKKVARCLAAICAHLFHSIGANGDFALVGIVPISPNILACSPVHLIGHFFPGVAAFSRGLVDEGQAADPDEE